MEREILFRGKRIDNGDWVFGDLIHNIDCVKVRERETDINRIAKSYEVIPETVCEWTGLTDKNGKKIFEGDVVVPVWVSPSGEIDGINKDMQGKVIYKIGSFYVVPRCEMEYQICDYVRKKFIEYRSNVGEIYDFANNMFLGEVIGNAFEVAPVLENNND